MPLKATGTISKDSPRYQEWLEVFGCETVTLLAPVPHKALGPDGTMQRFYKIDLSSLTTEQRFRLLSHLSKKFNISQEVIAQNLDAVGLPILADDVVVPMDMRFFL